MSIRPSCKPLFYVARNQGHEVRVVACHDGDVESNGCRQAIIERYRSGRLSHRQVGEALGLDYWQVEDFLKERGVPLNYSSEDLQTETAALRQLFTHS
jgi:predicted HTH domain antitoxin